MSEKAFLSIVTGIAGLILVGVSAGLPAAIGVLLCMTSHHLEKHVSKSKLKGGEGVPYANTDDLASRNGKSNAWDKPTLPPT